MERREDVAGCRERERVLDIWPKVIEGVHCGRASMSSSDVETGGQQSCRLIMALLQEQGASGAIVPQTQAQ